MPDTTICCLGPVSCVCACCFSFSNAADDPFRYSDHWSSFSFCSRRLASSVIACLPHWYSDSFTKPWAWKDSSLVSWSVCQFWICCASVALRRDNSCENWAYSSALFAASFIADASDLCAAVNDFAAASFLACISASFTDWLIYCVVPDADNPCAAASCSALIRARFIGSNSFSSAISFSNCVRYFWSVAVRFDFAPLPNST